jgi:alanyl-tRNA synthetase
MQPRTAEDIRSAFLDFFAQHDHTKVPSHSLLPPADPTLLFINAGMVQFKDYFTGARPAPYAAATSTQKCLRVSGKHNDLENVGRTRRHHTFFEMLGNFSFGAYFKSAAIEMAWSFLTETLGLPPERLLVTFFEGDDPATTATPVPRDNEAAALWKQLSGLPPERIVPMSAKDNFWAMGDTGPCGPCTEIYWDLHPEQGAHDFPANEDRYVEIWNLVFMQYDRDSDGRMSPLPAPCVDTGMGLERVASVVQQAGSNYDTDLLANLIRRASSMCGLAYGGRFDPEGVVSGDEDIERDVAFRVIADHARTTAFLIAEGIFPDNEGRGYVLRRVLRRGLRYGRKLGFDKPFLFEICDAVVENMGAAFPELVTHRDVIGRVVRQEEDRFLRTLDAGERLIAQALDRAESDGGDRVLDGQTAFLLYDSNGFPIDLTALICAERGFDVDMAGFDAAMAAQRERGRASWHGNVTAKDLVARMLTDEGITTRFVGFERDVVDDAHVLAIVDGVRLIDSAHAGMEVEVVLDRTPLYGEGGGQVGDIGDFAWNDLATAADRARVLDVQKPTPNVFLHRIAIDRGMLSVGDRVRVAVDAKHRAGVRAHHSATHLLHKALRDVLGGHVKQRGSQVEPGRLRFDFSHFAPVSEEELAAVERIANEMALRNEAADVEVMAMDAAVAKGALAFFGDKYGDKVRVVKLDQSIELCGGTHVARTGDCGLIKVVLETGVSAGVRRLEAECHLAAVERVGNSYRELERVGRRLGARMEEVDARVGLLLDGQKALQKEIDRLKSEVAIARASSGSGGAGGDEIRECGGLRLLVRRVQGVASKELRALGDNARDAVDQGVALVVAVDGDDVGLVVAVGKGHIDKVHAGNLIRELAGFVGGRGGGRADFAQAGGSDPSGVDAAVERFWLRASASARG